ncbi:MAG TPA: hypothetical protein VFF06_19430 [Polyangia bacterium]|nr:hypothetical protein [Polyangia bacterium]
MPRQKQLITESEIDAFANRLKQLVRQAGHDHSIAATLQKLAGSFSRAPAGRAASAPRAVKSGNGRRRRRGNPALEQKIVELVKASKAGLGSPDIAHKLGVPKERIKSIAQKLKGKGTFKVVGVKRQAKYQFAG